MTHPNYSPTGIFRDPHLQSVLASLRVRRWRIKRRHPQLRSSQRIILETSEGQLAADVNPHPSPVGHAVLIHGWEGSSESVYMVALGTFLYKRGFSVSRLNMRDHGETYHLNQGPFHGFLIQEVAEAVAQLCERYGQALPNVLSGFSMGGNFALRTAAKAKEMGIPLTATFAVSPAVRPLATMHALAKGPRFYHQYFRKKWQRSIHAKQKAWPNVYDFSQALELETLEEITEFFASAGLLPAQTAKDYLEGYQVTREHIVAIKHPTFILTAQDDPVIPVADIKALPQSRYVHTEITAHGGHCGFVEDFRFRSYISRWVFRQLQPLLAAKH